MAGFLYEHGKFLITYNTFLLLIFMQFLGAFAKVRKATIILKDVIQL
jgi:hypothetical protein